MLFFGHVGITLGLAKAAERVVAPARSRRQRVFRLADYWALLVGSMLPDLIDKPLGGLLLGESLGSGRTYGHTLVFLLALFSLSLWLWFRRRRSGLLVLAGGTFAHDVLDGMWRSPGTLFWPLFGWSFPGGDPRRWIWEWLHSLLHDPAVYVPEAVGGALLVWFAASM